MFGHKASARAPGGGVKPYTIAVGVGADQVLYEYEVNNKGTLTGVTFINRDLLATVTAISDYGMYYAFNMCTSLTGSVSFPALTTISLFGMSYAFYGCTSLTGSVSFPMLTTIGNHGMDYAFCGCTGLTGSVSFPSLTSIGDSGMNYAFKDTGITEVHFKSSLSGSSNLTADIIFGTTEGKSVLFDLS